MGYSQSRPQGTAVANPADIPKFEQHFQVLDLVGIGISPTGGKPKEYGMWGSRIQSKKSGGLLKGESCPQI